MELSYDDVGSGECVVLVHGHPFDRSLWEPQLAGLRDSFRVLAPDLRGFGRSPVTPGSVSMREYAADVEGLLDGLGITRAAVIGLSMGGLVAMELAVSQPGRYWAMGLPPSSPPSTSPRLAESSSSLTGASSDKAVNVLAAWVASRSSAGVTPSRAASSASSGRRPSSWVRSWAAPGRSC